MSLRWLFLVVSLSNLSIFVQAQCQPNTPLGGKFQVPQECVDTTSPSAAVLESNDVWALGSVQTVSWTTTFSSQDYYNLTLWQENPSLIGASVSSTPVYGERRQPLPCKLTLNRRQFIIQGRISPTLCLGLCRHMSSI
jgi:hypothetical protein